MQYLLLEVGHTFSSSALTALLIISSLLWEPGQLEAEVDGKERREKRRREVNQGPGVERANREEEKAE